MPRKGYKPSGYPIKRPDPVTFVARHAPTGAELFAELSNVPLYVKVRLLAPGLLPGSRRASFYLGWIIEERRWANQMDRYRLPEAILEWAAPLVQEAYPSVAESTGMDATEVAELIAEQKLKRAKHDKSRN